MRIVLDGRFGITLHLQLSPPCDGDLSSEECGVLWRREYRGHGYTLLLAREPDREALVASWELRRQDGGEFGIHCYELRFDVPLVDIAGLWYFYGEQDRRAAFHAELRIPWELEHRTGALSGVPAVLFHAGSGENRLFVGYLDQVPETEIRGSLDQNGCTYSVLMKRLFMSGRPARAREVRDGVYLSASSGLWSTVARRYAASVGRWSSYRPLEVPELARAPVWSSWYSLGDSLDERSVWENARLARSLGFGAVLFDAGWNTPPGGHWQQLHGPYGDYEPAPDRFPDLPSLVRRIRDELEMGVQFWVNPFSVGTASANHVRVSHLRCVRDGSESFYLCPYCSEARRWVAGVLESVVRRYALDGVWIDFLDAIPQGCESLRHAHDAGWNEGPAAAVSAMCEAIRRANPEAVVELRTRSANLFTRRYANVFQVNDSPGDWRFQATMSASLRCFHGGVVPKGDPAVWHPKELDHNVAASMATMLFAGVPCVSVDLTRAGQSHRDIVSSYLQFYQSHRDGLLAAESTADGPPGRVRSRLLQSAEALFVQALEGWVRLTPSVSCGPPEARPPTLFVFNCAEVDEILLDLSGFEGGLPGSVRTWDCHLRPARCRTRSGPRRGVLELGIPRGGIAELS